MPSARRAWWQDELPVPSTTCRFEVVCSDASALIPPKRVIVRHARAAACPARSCCDGCFDSQHMGRSDDVVKIHGYRVQARRRTRACF